MTTTFPSDSRERDSELLLAAALGVLKAMHGMIAELGGDADARHAFSYTVAETIVRIVGPPKRAPRRMEANILAAAVSDLFKSRARQERAEERAAAEKKRRARQVIQLRDRINAGFSKTAAASTRRSSGGDFPGPGPRAA